MQGTPQSTTRLTTLLILQAERNPHALAVADGDTTLTYAQLVSCARRLAGHLYERGVRPGDRVALLLPRSAKTVVAQVALWWAGATCVPLDPAHPRPRIEAMLADSEAGLTVGDAKLLEAADRTRSAMVLSDDVLHHDDLAEAPSADGQLTPCLPASDAPAFIMFTSGSTGRPKGVTVPHAAVARLVTDRAYVTITPRDRVLFHSPTTFDASTFEVWGALANGAAVVVCTSERPSFEDLTQDVERYGVTVAFFTTALFHQLAARRSRVFTPLRTLVVGGEALAAGHARSVRRAFPWLELINAYGPTETTVFATTHPVTDADCDEQIPIGRAVAGATAHVLDATGQAVPDGGRGELWIGGSRLADGYTGQPALTAERFVDHPTFGRLYRTGDLVSARPDGLLDFHGRMDDQVKVRGFRIEPGEIEHVLREQPEVDDAAVTVRRPSADDARLAAFVVAAPGPVPRPETLRTRLAGLLPAHLVPDELTLVERLPLTPTGKVDRRLLAAHGTADATAGAAARMTPLQQAVADVWSRSLGSQVTAPDADFIALGGHSMLALVIVDDLREDLGVELTLAEFFTAPTVAEQAALVERVLLATHDDLHPDALEDTDGR